MHLVQAEDEDILVTAFLSKTELPEEFYDAFESDFLAALKAGMSSHPGASLCRACRERDIESWKGAFGELVSSAYGELSPEVLPVDVDELPDMVRMEFESMLRESERRDSADLS